ncbi:MAG: thymidine phosphorylase, partial [Rhizobacter sp.]
LLALTLALAGQMLQLAGLATSPDEGERQAQAALDSGTAAERFARMVAGLGGPRDVLTAKNATGPQAPVQLPLLAARDGRVGAMDTRAIGLAIVALGGGRARADAVIDPRVGISDLLPIGAPVVRHQPLAVVHAADEDSAVAAMRSIAAAIRIADTAEPPTLVHAVIAQ